MGKNFKITSKIEGLDDLLNDIEKLDLVDSILSEAAKSAAETVLPDILTRVPVKTGNLKGSLVIREIKNKSKGRKSFGIETKVPYASVIELGNSDTKPRAYMRQGFEKKKDLAEKAISKVFEKAIDKIWG